MNQGGKSGVSYEGFFLPPLIDQTFGPMFLIRTSRLNGYFLSSISGVMKISGRVCVFVS